MIAVAHPLVLLAWFALGVVALLAGIRVVRRRRAPEPPDALRLANAARLAESRAWRRRLVVYRALLVLTLTAVLAAGLSAAVLSARVVERDTADPRLRVRDVMLCLDVSTSMQEADQQVLREYERLVRRFRGERIGLTIFNSAPVSVFPLTSDYDYAVQQLRLIGRSFGYVTQGGIPSIYSGTVYGETGSSLIGDGLASCLARLHDAGEERRSSSVILATDNAVGGAPLITLGQAAGIAERTGVRVYGLDGSPRAGTQDPAAVAFREAVRHTGGAYFPLADSETVTQIVEAVRERQAEAVPSAPRVQERDAPEAVWVVLSVAVGLLLVLAWRLRL